METFVALSREISFVEKNNNNQIALKDAPFTNKHDNEIY